MEKRLLQGDVELHVLDLKNGDDIRTFKFDIKYDIIYHMAAKASIPESFDNPPESHSHNVVGTLRILEHARKTGAKVVFSSSSSADNPVSPYALQKRICEDYMRIYWDLGVKSVALRYFNVYGEGQEFANEGANKLVLAQLLEMYKNNTPFYLVECGNRRRDFVYVEDVIDANVMAGEWLNSANGFEVFDVGTGTNHSIKGVAQMIDPNRAILPLPSRVEPLVNLADKSKFLPQWQPKQNLRRWIEEQLV